jgi:hypothetical protein
MFTPAISPRKYSKTIFNSLSCIALMSAFKVSILLSQNTNSDTKTDYDNCPSYCEYKNSTLSNTTSMLEDCTKTALPMETNVIFIGIICTLWFLSNLELILETHFEFMPWNKFIKLKYESPKEQNEEEGKEMMSAKNPE